jgi:hypothetical protein
MLCLCVERRNKGIDNKDIFLIADFTDNVQTSGCRGFAEVCITWKILLVIQDWLTDVLSKSFSERFAN